MKKEYLSGWNIQKQKINNENFNKFYHQRDIWWCHIGVNIGFEQDGKGPSFERPFLILRGFNKETCLGVPLTTSKKINKFLVPIGNMKGKNAQVILSQIRMIDTKRLVNKICVLDKKTFYKIRKSIKKLF